MIRTLLLSALVATSPLLLVAQHADTGTHPTPEQSAMAGMNMMMDDSVMSTMESVIMQMKAPRSEH